MQKFKSPLFFLGSLSALALVSFDLYQPALPQILKHFNASYELGQLTFSLYLFIFGLAQLLWGPLVDHFGRRRVLPVSIGLFLLATVACMLATNMLMLVLARGVQGFSACCAGIVSLSTTRDCENNNERARLLSHLSMVVALSPIFAPLIGSLLLLFFNWQSNFILMALFSIYLLTSSYFVLYESPYWTRSDKPFAVISTFKIYKKLLSDKRLWAGACILTMSFAMLMTFVINAAYILITRLHFTPFIFAVLFGINGLFIIIGQFIGIKLRERYSLLWNIRLGSTLLTGGAFLTFIIYLFAGLSLFTLMPVFIISLATSILNPPVFSLTLSYYPSNAATATSLIKTFQMSGSAALAGGVGSLLTVSFLFFPLGLMLCSLLCFIVSYYITESEAQVL